MPAQGTPAPTPPARTGVSTAIFAIATFLSRIAGMVRQIVVAWKFGSSSAYAAFTVASQVPNLLRALVADSALSAAFVPVFTRLDETGERERAWRVASTFVSLILLVLGPLTILTMACAPWIVRLLIGQESFAPETVELAVTLTRIMMPIVVLMALSGLIVGVLNSYGHFSTPALAPIAWNAVLLAALIGGTPFVDERYWAHLYAVAMLVGTLVQVLLPVPWLRGRGGRLRIGGGFGDPCVREVLVLMLPVTISLGLINIQQVIDTAFATRVPHDLIPNGLGVDAGPAIMEYAFRLYMLPQGVFSVAVSTVFFPLLARQRARGDDEGFRRSFAEGLGQIFLLLIPSAAFLGLFATDVTRAIYEYGAFGPSQTAAVASTLAAFSLGLVFNGASLLVIRALFSIQRPWLPTLVSILTLAVNVLANIVFYRIYGLAGIALSTSLVNLVGFLALYLALRRRVGRLHGRITMRTAGASLAITGIAMGGGWLAAEAVGRLMEGRAGDYAQLATAMLVCGVVYGFGVLRVGLIAPSLAQRLPAWMQRQT